MAPKYICVCFENAPNKIYDDSRYKNCSVQKLIAKKVLEDKLATFVHTPNFMIGLSVTEVPLKTYPSLMLSQKPTMYRRPEYYLFQTSNFANDTIVLFINVRSNADYEIPRIPFSLRIQDLNSLTVGDMKRNILETINNEAQIAGFKVDDMDVFDNDEYLSNYIDFESPKNLVLEIIFSRKLLSNMQLRTNLIKEIKTTEEQFKNDLKIINHSQTQFKQKNILTDSEYNLIFHDIPFIKKIHSSFFKKLAQEEKNGYSSMISVTFLEMLDALKTSQNFISLYPSIIELLDIKKQNRTFVSCLTEFQQAYGKDLAAYLITPVQRLPRYLLFLKELERITPKIHPDSELLPLALDLIEKLNQDTDCLTKQTKQQTLLKEIEDKLKKYNVHLVDPSRKIVMLVEVELKTHKKTVQAQLCLCNDLVFLYVNHGKTAKLIYSQSLNKFHYLPNTSEFCTVEIPFIKKVKDQYERKELKIIFSKLEEKMQFLDNVQYFLDDLIFSQEKNDKEKLLNRQIYWTLNSISDSIPTICQHNCISNGENVIFYGGISTPQRLIYSDFSSYRKQYLRDVPLSEMTTMESGIFGRRKCTFTYLKDHFYLIGGFVGSNEVSEMFRYDINTGKWHQFCIKKNFNIHGHTCIPYQNLLYVYGGKSKENGYNSEIYVLNTDNETLETINVIGEKPKPRTGHSAVIYNDKMFVYGGKYSKSIYSDLWSFDLKTKRWRKEEINDIYLPRKWHLSFVLGSEMLIIGGISDKDEAESFTIDLKNLKVYNVEDYGNFPSSLHHTCGAILNNNEIVVYGGVEFKSKTPLSTLYILKLSPTWKRRIKLESRNALHNYFDQEKWNDVLNSACCHTIITHRSTYNPQKNNRNNTDHNSIGLNGKPIINGKKRSATSRRASIASLIKQVKPQAKTLSPMKLSFGETSESLAIEKIETNDIVKIRHTNQIIKPKTTSPCESSTVMKNEQTEQSTLTPRQLIEYKKSIRTNSVRCKTMNNIYNSKAINESIRRGTIQSKTLNRNYNDMKSSNPNDINQITEPTNSKSINNDNKSNNNENKSNNNDKNILLNSQISFSENNFFINHTNENEMNIKTQKSKIIIDPMKKISINKEASSNTNHNHEEQILPNNSHTKKRKKTLDKKSSKLIETNDNLTFENEIPIRSKSIENISLNEGKLPKEKSNIEKGAEKNKQNLLLTQSSSNQQFCYHKKLETSRSEMIFKNEQNTNFNMNFQPFRINPRNRPKLRLSNMDRTCKRWENFENISKEAQDNV